MRLRNLCVFGALTLMLCATTAAQAQLSFTTLFGNVPGPTPSAADPGLLADDVGLFPSDAVLGPIANFANFNVQNLNQDLLGGGANEGQILFFQNGQFYVGGAGAAAANPLTSQGAINLQDNFVTDGTGNTGVVNNRAYGVFGTGRSDFTFDLGTVTSVSLQARGTADGLSVGSDAALGQSLPENSPLADASATLLVYTNLGLQSSTTVSNASFETFNVELGGTLAALGDSITRISLVNQGPLNSALVLGELTVGTVGLDAQGLPIPEPATISLVALSVGMMTLRRRR